MLNNSAGVFGTRLIIILLPSVEPIPIDVNERIDGAFENILNEPLQSFAVPELFCWINVYNGCGDVADDVNVTDDGDKQLLSDVRDN